MATARRPGAAILSTPTDLSPEAGRRWLRHRECHGERNRKERCWSSHAVLPYFGECAIAPGQRAEPSRVPACPAGQVLLLQAPRAGRNPCRYQAQLQRQRGDDFTARGMNAVTSPSLYSVALAVVANGSIAI